MKKREVEDVFAAEVIPEIEKLERPGHADLPLRRLSWSQYIDNLHRNGDITEKQAMAWTIPHRFLRRRPTASNGTRPRKTKNAKRKKAPARSAKKKRTGKSVLSAALRRDRGRGR